MKKITVTYSIFLLYLTACMASSASNPSMPTTSLPDVGVNPGASSTTIRYSTTSSTTSSSSTTYEITTPEEEYNTTLTPISTEPATTTTTPYCPGEEDVCYVERDMTGDNELECCNEKDNTACSLCLPVCKTMCQQRGEGVEYCFGSNTTFGCECTQGSKPTCYQTTTTTTTHVTTTYAGIVDATKANKTVYYIILIIITLAVLVGAIYYLRKI